MDLMTTRWTRPLVGLALVGAFTTGCPSPSIYGTARTLPRGTVQHTLAAEVIGAVGNGTAVFPTLPTYQLRLGLADNVDLGFRLGNIVSPGVDVKINFVRGAFDLAIDPGIQGMYLATSDEGAGFVYLNLPLILGFNLSRSFSILATPGVAYAAGFGTTSSSSGGSTSATTYNGTGFMPRFGVGLNIRVNNSFAIQPEWTGYYFVDSSAVLFTFGIGFTFGAQPDFSDIQ
jgi:hypothetical protein